MKMADYSAGRADGLLLALQIVEDKGVQGLRDEIKFRGLFQINTSLAKKDLEQAAAPIKANTIALSSALTISTLHDEFDFGKIRMRRFKERFDFKTECIIDDMLTWDDVFRDVYERLGIDLELNLGDLVR